MVGWFSRLIVIVLLCAVPLGAMAQSPTACRRADATAAQGAGTRPTGGADRAPSGSAAVRDIDRRDLSARGRAGGPLGQVQQDAQGRCAHRRDRQAELGRQREIAGPGSDRAGDDGGAARLDAEARRRHAGAAGRRHGRNPAAAHPCAEQRQAEVHQGADGHGQDRGRQAIRRDRADLADRNLRSVLRARRGLRGLALS